MPVCKVCKKIRPEADQFQTHFMSFHFMWSVEIYKIILTGQVPSKDPNCTTNLVDDYFSFNPFLHFDH